MVRSGWGRASSLGPVAGWGVGKVGLMLLAAIALLAGGCGQYALSGTAGARPAPRVLVGIAASDGVGIGATNPDRDNWVAQLGARLPAGTRVINLGISGATAAQAAEQELPVALDASPGAVAVWLGVNDFEQSVPLPAFSQNLTDILGALRQQTSARVYVGNLPDLRLLPAFSSRPPEALNGDVGRWNDEIARVTAASGARLVDIYSAWTAPKDRGDLVSSDGLHPTTAGYQRIADLFWQSMRAAG